MNGTENKQSNEIKQLYLDFEKFKIEIKETIQALLDKKFANIYWLAGVCSFVFSIVFYFVYDLNNSRFDRLEQATYVPSNEVLINEIRSLKEQISNMKTSSSLDSIHLEDSIHLDRHKLPSSPGELRPATTNRANRVKKAK